MDLGKHSRFASASPCKILQLISRTSSQSRISENTAFLCWHLLVKILQLISKDNFLNLGSKQTQLFWLEFTCKDSSTDVKGPPLKSKLPDNTAVSCVHILVKILQWISNHHFLNLGSRTHSHFAWAFAGKDSSTKTIVKSTMEKIIS